MKNVIAVIFEEESKAYEVLSELKIYSGTTMIETAGIIKKENGSIAVKDGFNFANIGDNWAIGGIIGGVVGILGGPLGILITGGIGALIGAGVDIDKEDHTESLMKHVASQLNDNTTALLIIAEESDETELNQLLLSSNSLSIFRQNAASITSEISQEHYKYDGGTENGANKKI